MGPPDTPAAERWVSSSKIRDDFSGSMSAIYKAEVPLYADLISLVSDVNIAVLKSDHDLRAHLAATDELGRLNVERHGAIRLGTALELQTMKRFLLVMGMEPVGYYDLSQAGLPVHATCFRTTDLKSLAANPFRLFTSLLRPEMISENLRARTMEILSRRQMFSDRLLTLIAAAEVNGGLNADEAAEFVSEGLEIFEWSSQATVSLTEYEELQKESPLLADVAAFPGTHINHLTPRTLDIDAVQSRLEHCGIPMKEAIEGPPRRRNPILLRQTSFKALEEKVYFPSSKANDDAPILGSHTARFGEIEQRGAALTPKGREIYDMLVVDAARKGLDSNNREAYEEIFAAFPDNLEVMRKEKLAWFRFFVAEGNLPISTNLAGATLEDLIDRGYISYEPLVYEDFLPLSAAGIFQSNLDNGAAKGFVAHVKTDSGKDAFEQALQGRVRDEMQLYREIEEASVRSCLTSLGLSETVKS